MKQNFNDAIRHYEGRIRDQDAQIKTLTVRIKNLENKVKKLNLNNPYQPSNLELFGMNDFDNNAQDGVYGGEGISQGGFTASEIKAMVRNWLLSGELGIPLHDHINTSAGGDCYSHLGAALQ